MKANRRLHRSLQALIILGLSILASTPVHTQYGLTPVRKLDYVRVTAENYVRAESDIQMKGYIEKFGCSEKFHRYSTLDRFEKKGLNHGFVTRLVFILE